MLLTHHRQHHQRPTAIFCVCMSELMVAKWPLHMIPCTICIGLLALLSLLTLSSLVLLGLLLPPTLENSS